MQEGIGLGGFYFHPTNGEPTPSVNVFSRQVVKEDYLKLSQLPPVFAEAWSSGLRSPEYRNSRRAISSPVPTKR